MTIKLKNLSPKLKTKDLNQLKDLKRRFGREAKIVNQWLVIKILTKEIKENQRDKRVKEQGRKL